MNSRIVWYFGRAGAGKSTKVRNRLPNKGMMFFPYIWLDGDMLRKGLNRYLTFSEIDRRENLWRAAEIARLLHDQGHFIICSFITPTQEMRDMVEKICSPEMIYVDTPIEICKKRRPALYENENGGGYMFEEPPKGKYKVVKGY